MRFDNCEVNVYHTLEEHLRPKYQWLGFDGLIWHEIALVFFSTILDVKINGNMISLFAILGGICRLQIELGIFCSNMPLQTINLKMEMPIWNRSFIQLKSIKGKQICVRAFDWSEASDKIVEDIPFIKRTILI